MSYEKAWNPFHTELKIGKPIDGVITGALRQLLKIALGRTNFMKLLVSRKIKSSRFE